MNDPQNDKEPVYEDCHVCDGSKYESISDCCRESISIIKGVKTCSDCGHECHAIRIKCRTCEGYGELMVDEETIRERHNDIRESEATGN